MPMYYVRVLGGDHDLFTSEWHRAETIMIPRRGSKNATYKPFEAQNEEHLLKQINALLPEIYQDEVAQLLPSIAPFPIEKVGERRYRAALMDINEYLEDWSGGEEIDEAVIDLEANQDLLAIGIRYDPETSILDNLEHDLDEEATYFEWEPLDPAYIPRTLEKFKRSSLYRASLLNGSNGILCSDGEIRYSSTILEKYYDDEAFDEEE